MAVEGSWGWGSPQRRGPRLLSPVLSPSPQAYSASGSYLRSRPLNSPHKPQPRHKQGQDWHLGAFLALLAPPALCLNSSSCSHQQTQRTNFLLETPCSREKPKNLFCTC